MTTNPVVIGEGIAAIVVIAAWVFTTYKALK